MKIIADENIARVEVFQFLGDLVTLPGRDISTAVLKDADALLIRSVTKINEDLLAHTSLKFVASATSGIDHVDSAYLSKQNIAFHYAPACNARSVVEYVFSAIAYLSQKHDFDWRACSFGIIGGGNIGGLLARYLAAMKIDYAIYDPFLADSGEHAGRFVSFSEVLQRDVLSIHAPLTFESEYPSHHLFSENIIETLTPGKILINAARGAVVDNQALLRRLQADNDLLCVLDAWENEPAIELDLLNQVELATPHIAGYSLDGKLKGTEMIFTAFCDFFQLDKDKGSTLFEAQTSVKRISTSADKSSNLKSLNSTLLKAYDIRQDYYNMQALLTSQTPAFEFDQLRKNYPIRLEYSAGENLPVY